MQARTLWIIVIMALGCADGAAIRDANRGLDEDAFNPPSLDMETVDAHVADIAVFVPVDASFDEGVDGASGGACEDSEYLPPVEEQCDWLAADQPQCPEGYRCLVIANTGPDAIAVCVAPDCVDIDRDGHGVGPACAGADCNDCNVLVHAGAAEICDGLDNDCNGAIDDEVDPLQSPLNYLSLGVCAGSESVCRAGEWRCGYGDGFQEVETLCDGLDNDCDGRIDNVDGIGEPCTAGEGACASDGVQICDGLSGGLICNATALEPLDEQCNGVDDDCNGAIDDVIGVGEACVLRSGACESPGVRQCDPVRRLLVCNAPAPMPRDEICDQRDNDCDGEVDEELECIPPAEECNNLDDDNDDVIDEDSDVACNAACGAGVQRCIAGVLGPCEGAAARDEICNGEDDDCDGETDEGLIEVCGNGEDDDCDGVADEAGACGGCAGVADGTVIDPGVWGECGGFIDACDETGRQARVQVFCDAGERRERDDEQACARDTDGINVGDDEWGECGGFDGPCDETGEETRGRRVCQDGVEVGEREARPCQRITDGQVIDEGDFGACGGFIDACDETGRQVRQRRICRDGREEIEDDEQACERDTEGVIVDAGDWGACREFSDDCDETGRQVRTQRICRDGREQAVDESQVCERDTTGVVVSVGNWGQCGGFSDDCDETGREERVRRVCRDGREQAEDESQACERGTEGDVISVGNWGQCGGFSSECDETGRETRERRVCRGGRERGEDESRECFRNVAGDPEVCNGRDDDCDGRTDERVLNACGECGPDPRETCNGRDDDCDGRTDEGDGDELCGDRNVCAAGRCCADNDRDGHGQLACGGDDCDDGDAYKHPGRDEKHDIRDNDCDGNADNLGLVRLNRYRREWNANDWEHRFASRQPAGFSAWRGRYIDVYPTNFCGSNWAPEDQCDRLPVNGDDGSAQGALIQLRHGLMVGLMQCTGQLGVHHITLLLTEDSGEYRGYRDEQPRRLNCSRIGYVYGGVTWRNVVGGTADFYRLRSDFGPPGKGDNLWLTDPNEPVPTYGPGGLSFRTKSGF